MHVTRLSVDKYCYINSLFLQIIAAHPPADSRLFILHSAVADKTPAKKMVIFSPWRLYSHHGDSRCPQIFKDTCLI